MKLKNEYWILRHGRSKPNERGLIVSHLSNGVLEEHGLSAVGVKQAEEAGHLFLKELLTMGLTMDKVRIYCSPFSRTVDTAKAVVHVLKLEPSKIKYSEHLRERYFGPALELQSHEHYPEIWALDEHNSLVGPVGGESVADVAVRLTRVIQQIEIDCEGCAVLVVSHGDPLQIFQTVVKAAQCASNDCLEKETQYDPLVLSQHRRYALQTGELRKIS